jgi:hypothetical protein
VSVRVTGMREWLDDLETLAERAEPKFKAVMGQAGMNMKADWKAQWEGMPHAHIPWLVRNIGYDVPPPKGFTFTVEVGITPHRPQSRLASFIEFGTLTSGPHPAGMPALEREAPRMAQWAEKVAADLLEGNT